VNFSRSFGNFCGSLRKIGGVFVILEEILGEGIFCVFGGNLRRKMEIFEKMFPEKIIFSV
jgi:hypothetical protein